MRTKKRQKQADGLDEWADKVAGLQPDAVASIIEDSQRIVSNKQLTKADRDFAEAQVDAVRRAIARRKKRESRKKRVCFS